MADLLLQTPRCYGIARGRRRPPLALRGEARFERAEPPSSRRSLLRPLLQISAARVTGSGRRRSRPGPSLPWRPAGPGSFPTRPTAALLTLGARASRARAVLKAWAMRRFASKVGDSDALASPPPLPPRAPPVIRAAPRPGSRAARRLASEGGSGPSLPPSPRLGPPSFHHPRLGASVAAGPGGLGSRNRLNRVPSQRGGPG
jgi:hypothetical protein